MPFKLIRTWALLFLSLLGTANLMAQGKAYFSIGTNALYDVVAIPNLEAEVAFAGHWSVLGEFAGTKVTDMTKKNVVQLVNGGLEGRYWFKSLAMTPLAGHFLGAFAHCAGFFRIGNIEVGVVIAGGRGT